MFNNDKLRIYYDAEFTGLRKDTSLISIGLVSESGAYFYAEFTDYDQSQINDWIQEHVIDNLIIKDKEKIYTEIPMSDGQRHYNVLMKANKNEIGKFLRDWLLFESNTAGEKQIQIYTDCYAYDWVLLNDIICEDGLALNLPKYVYYIPYDLSTLMQVKDIDPDVTREEFIGQKTIDYIRSNKPFSDWGDNCKHNSLWDAMVARCCFMKINKEGSNE